MRLLVFFLVTSLKFVNGVWHHREDSKGVESLSWLEWFSVTIYRGFYVTLITGILSCAVYNIVKNRTSKNLCDCDQKKCFFEGSKIIESCYSNVLSSSDSNLKNGMAGLLCSEMVIETGREMTSGDSVENESGLRERMQRVQEEIQSLREQLTYTMDNKADLESSLAMLDKEKITAEMQLELDRVQGSLELEKLRKDNITVQREITRLVMEKEQAEKEVERLDRDSRISRSASVDGEFLEERLGAAKEEALRLRDQFKILAKEKHRACTLLSDIPKITSNLFGQDVNMMVTSDLWMNSELELSVD